MIWLVIVGGTVLVSGVTSALLSHYRGAWSILDEPNQRSLHHSPVPRSGGVAILLGILFACIVVCLGTGPAAPVLSLALIVTASVLVAAISFLDDIYGISVTIRLIVQLAAAVLVVLAGLYINILELAGGAFQPSTWLGIVLALIFIIWMVNLYNFMDGMDGFAAGMGVSGFGTFALLGALAGHMGFAQVNAGVATACLGFLLFNFPPARIFMGDIGAASLGFLAAVMMLWANQQVIFPLWVGVLVFSPFIVDATWTLLRRVLKGKQPWDAHREHFYQRLVQCGWGHRKVVLGEYSFMIFCSALGIGTWLVRNTLLQWMVIAILVVAYISLGLMIGNLELEQYKKGI